MDQSSDPKKSLSEISEDKAKSKQEHLDLYDTIKEYGTRAILIFAPLHYLLHPEDLAVLLVDYLKIHPAVASSIPFYRCCFFTISLVNEVLSRIVLSKYAI